MNELTVFQFNEVYQPNGVQSRASAGGWRSAGPLQRKITYKGASVASCVSIGNTHTPLLVFWVVFPHVFILK